MLRLAMNTGFPASGTLSLATPAAYSSLAVLASSGAAFGMGNGTLTLHFTDGTSSGPFNYDASDWNIFVGHPNDLSDVALGPLGRNEAVNADFSQTEGSNFLTNTGDISFVLYETDINLAALGLDAKTLASITFTSASNSPDPAAITGVFAVSGVSVAAQAVPEPSSFVLLGMMGTAAGLCGWRRRKATATA